MGPLLVKELLVSSTLDLGRKHLYLVHFRQYVVNSLAVSPVAIMAELWTLSFIDTYHLTTNQSATSAPHLRFSHHSLRLWPLLE